MFCNTYILFCLKSQQQNDVILILNFCVPQNKCKHINVNWIDEKYHYDNITEIKLGVSAIRLQPQTQFSLILTQLPYKIHFFSI
jgi:hypothetical protein